MSTVEPKRLGDLITLKRGYDLPEKNRVNGDYPVISSAGISGYHNEYKVEGEGVVTGRYGTLGQMYYVDGKYWPHNTALYVKDFKGNDPRYIYYLLGCIGRIRTSDKSAVPGVNRNELHEMAVPAVSKKSDQISLRHLLWTIDKKIELNNKINAELEAMAKLIYDYWFVQFDFPDANGKPYKSSGGKMVYNEELKREIPEGWDSALIAEKLSIGSGYPFSSGSYLESGKYKIITIKNVQDTGLDTDKTDFINEIPGKVKSFCILDKQDVLISLTGNVGRLCIVDEDGLLLNQRVGKFLCSSRWRWYFYCLYSRPELRTYMESFSTGCAQKNLSPIDAVRKFHPVPPENILQKFNEAIEPSFKLIIKKSLESKELEALKDWLLPMLMNGQVTVKSENAAEAS